MLMLNKTVIVTGSNSGIGKYSAIELCKMGAHVVMACRETAHGNEKSVFDVMEEIKAMMPNAQLSFIPLDLSCFESIRNFANQFNQQHTRLDVLLNNAGVVCLDKRTSVEGFELTMGVNHLGPFLLTNLLSDTLINTPGARVVNVSSKAHAKGKIKFSGDTIKERRPFRGLITYADSKLANIYFTQELAERLSDHKVTVNALHPGGVASNIWPDSKGIVGMIRRRIIKNLKKPERGASTSIYLCTSPEVEGVSGKYFYKNKQIEPHRRAKKVYVQKKLWRVSETCTGLA